MYSNHRKTLYRNLYTWPWVTVYTHIFDFIKTNHQFHLKMLRKLHSIFIKIGTLLCGMLSFNITSVFRLFSWGETFVYMHGMLRKSDNSHNIQLLFNALIKLLYIIPGRKWLRLGNHNVFQINPPRAELHCD